MNKTISMLLLTACWVAIIHTGGRDSAQDNNTPNCSDPSWNVTRPMYARSQRDKFGLSCTGNKELDDQRDNDYYEVNSKYPNVDAARAARQAEQNQARAASAASYASQSNQYTAQLNRSGASVSRTNQATADLNRAGVSSSRSTGRDNLAGGGGEIGFR